MLSVQLFRLIVEEREREIQQAIKARHLLRPSEPESPEPASPLAQSRPSWRARTPRASATTR